MHEDLIKAITSRIITRLDHEGYIHFDNDYLGMLEDDTSKDEILEQMEIIIYEIICYMVENN